MFTNDNVYAQVDAILFILINSTAKAKTYILRILCKEPKKNNANFDLIHLFLLLFSFSFFHAAKNTDGIFWLCFINGTFETRQKSSSELTYSKLH